MKRLPIVVLLVVLSGLLAILPATAQDDAVLETNLTNECVTDYDSEVDYFPEKVELTDAENFAVEYFNHYKVVTVTDAFDAAEPFTYVLVQCGTPAPEADDFPDDTQFLEVPAGDIIAMSTTQLPPLVQLGLLDNLIAMNALNRVNTPAVRERIEAGALSAVGGGAEVNVEVVLDLEPDIVMTFGFNPDTDAHPVLIESGIFTALNASWREATPLGRAEWLKHTALFYNVEAQAEAIYTDIVTQYAAAAELAAGVPQDERPVVLWNRFSPFTEAWTIPGAETYAGRLILDAGGQIALGELAPDENAPVSFEVIVDGALDADIWVTNASGMTTFDDLLAADPRFGDFAAAQNGAVWNNTLDLNENGGNNYFELGVTNPHLILQDLVAIFHPELVPDHEFNFYLPLEPKSE